MSRLPALALRNVGRNRRRTVITALTIVFGVAMVCTVRGVMWGLQSMMIDDTVEGRLGALQVHRAGFVDNLDAAPLSLSVVDSEALRARIAETPNVAAVSGRILFGGLVSNGRSQTMFVGRGLDVASEPAVCPRAATTLAPGGRLLQPGDGPRALLGHELAQSFGLAPGASLAVQATSPSGRSNSLDLELVGLSTSAFPFENKRVLTVPLATAQALVGLEGRVTEYAVRVAELSRLDETAAELRRRLGPDFEVHTWRELQPFLRDLIYRQNLILSVIAAALVVVVVTGIVNTMLMSVFERVREIGTLLAVGVRRRQVMTLFLIEAAAIGLLGGLAGAGLGRLIVGVAAALELELEVSGLNAVSTLRPVVTWPFLGLAVAVALVGAVGAALWPAWRASRMNPVDALRS